MPLYRNTGEATFRARSQGVEVDPGETVELPESSISGHEDRFEEVDTEPTAEGQSEAESEPETESSEEEDVPPSEDEESADAASTESEGEDEESDEEDSGAEPPLDPTSLSVDNLRTELNAQDFSNEELDTILAIEESQDEPRSTAIEAIEDARE